MRQDPTSPPTRGSATSNRTSSETSWSGRDASRSSSSFESSRETGSLARSPATRSGEPPHEDLPTNRALILAERSDRPSITSIVLATSIGALVGGVIPFLLGRRSQNSWQSGERARGSSARGAVGEQRIPIFEEQLVVGKKEVPRGGARVHSYIKETPVHEQVSLREEHVSVERQPVSDQLQSGEVPGDMLQERTVEMKATAEEAVVAKEAHVREEVVVKKSAEQRTEDVTDTVRHTEVEVEDGARATRLRDGGL